MDYWDLRKAVAKIIPRQKPLFTYTGVPRAVKEKGRKSGYKEFKLMENKWVKQERLLNTEEVNSFIEVSCRAHGCPMPVNIDIWDGLLCPFGCKYCFANAFRASLYTAFFDNSKTMGFRHCSPKKYRKELDEIMVFKGQDPLTVKSSTGKAIAMNIPLRFGIRFEDFLDEEREAGISLDLLNYLKDHEYPLMINTKSALVGEEKYLTALADNKGKTAVHVTLISSNNEILSAIEPGAPTYKQRLEAMENMVNAGIRVVARIEPYIPFVTDTPDDVAKYMEDMKRIGVKNITFDTYHYTANNPGIRQSFKNMGLDWERMFLIGCDSQAIGSLLLGEFMKLFRKGGFSCSTFDMGNQPDNDQTICCEVEDWFTDSGFNYGCTVVAARYVQQRKGKPVSWSRFRKYVMKKGGFLSDDLEKQVHMLWNCQDNNAYSHSWSRGLHAVSMDGDGIIWKYKNDDFRKEILENLI